MTCGSLSNILAVVAHPRLTVRVGEGVGGDAAAERESN